MFSVGPFSDAYRQRSAGHSLELHYVYASQLDVYASQRARVIAFIEDCRARRREA